MKILRHILAVVAAILAFFAVGVLISLVIGLIGMVPFLRTILYWPAGAGWVSIVTPPIFGILAGAYISNAIVKTARPFCVVMIINYVLNILTKLLLTPISWSAIIASLIGLGAAVICTDFGSKRGEQRTQKP